MSGKDPLKTAYLFARLREHKSRPRQKQTAQRAARQADKLRRHFLPAHFVGARSRIAHCLPVTVASHKNRPRNGVRACRQKTSLPARQRTKPIKTAQRAINCAERKGRQFLPSSCFRFSFEREIFRSDESHPRSSIPSAVLARGKTRYERKRSAQNRVFICPLARSNKYRAGKSCSIFRRG